MTERCFPQNLVLGDSGFGCVYRYHSTKLLEDMLGDPVFFLPVRSQLRAGDEIRIFQMEDADIQGHDNRVLRCCDVIVVGKSQRAVFLKQIGPIHEMPLDFVEVEEAAAARQERPKLTSKWNGPADKYIVVDEDGTVLAKGIGDKKVVEQMTAGKLPLPDAVPPPAAAPQAPTPPAAESVF